MLALQVYEDGVCACGFHESLIDPETLHVTFEPKVCPVCAGGEQWARVQQAADDEFDKGLGKDPSPKAVRPSDGRRTFIRQMTPEEVDERRSRAESRRATPGEAVT